MSEDNWSVKEKVCVSPKLPPNPALDYVRPEITKVAVDVRADEGFEPSHGTDKNSIVLFANIPSGELILSSRSSAKVDCGFSMKTPAGYQLRVLSIFSGLFVNLEDSKRIVLTVFNAGEELVLQHRQAFAKMWIEPVYYLQWN